MAKFTIDSTKYHTSHTLDDSIWSIRPLFLSIRPLWSSNHEDPSALGINPTALELQISPLEKVNIANSTTDSTKYHTSHTLDDSTLSIRTLFLSIRPLWSSNHEDPSALGINPTALELQISPLEELNMAKYTIDSTKYHTSHTLDDSIWSIRPLFLSIRPLWSSNHEDPSAFGINPTALEFQISPLEELNMAKFTIDSTKYHTSHTLDDSIWSIRPLWSSNHEDPSALGINPTALELQISPLEELNITKFTIDSTKYHTSHTLDDSIWSIRPLWSSNHEDPSALGINPTALELQISPLEELNMAKFTIDSTKYHI